MSKRSRERPVTNMIKLDNIKLSKVHRILGTRWRDPGSVPVVVVPKRRGTTDLRMVIPDGTHCVVTESAKAIGVFKPGLYYRSSFFEISHCVTTQYIPYHYSITSCPTRDNVNISINVDFLLHIQNAFTFVLEIGLDNLEELVRSTQTQAVRSLVRSFNSCDAYDIRGQNSESILETLNDTLEKYGVSIVSLSIASVVLPPSLAKSLQDATTISAQKARQLKIQELSMRSQNALQLLNRIKIDKRNELQKIQENMQKEYDIISNDMKEVIAKKEKEIQRLEATLRDRREQLRAQGNFEVAKLNAQRDLEVNNIINNARIEAQQIRAESDLYVTQVKADVEFKVAQNKSKIIALRGEAEKIAQAALAAQRDFEFRMKEIAILHSVASNPQNIISGESENNDIAKLLVASKTAESMGVKMRKY